MKRRTVVAYVAAVTILALTACSGGGDDADTAGDSAAHAPAAADEEASGAGQGERAAPGSDADDGQGGSADGQAESSGGVVAQIQDHVTARDIIHTVDLEIDVEDIAGAAERAGSIARAGGGFIAEETTTGSTSSLTLRIPVDAYTDSLRELQELGVVTHRATTTQDVTQQIVDTESRIASQRESIARIRELLRDATDLSDVIAIESELAAREADLDSLLSRQERLQDLTSLATVNVTLVAEDSEDDEDETTFGFFSGLSGGWDAFVTTLSVGAGVLAAMLPFLVLLALIGAPAWVWYRRRRAGHPSAAAVPPSA